MILDSTAEEQESASCVISIAVDQRGNCCGMEYLQPGTMSSTELVKGVEVKITRI